VEGVSQMHVPGRITPHPLPHLHTYSFRCMVVGSSRALDQKCIRMCFLFESHVPSVSRKCNRMCFIFESHVSLDSRKCIRMGSSSEAVSPSVLGFFLFSAVSSCLSMCLMLSKTLRKNVAQPQGLLMVVEAAQPSSA
jgi:hypothetical protein